MLDRGLLSRLGGQAASFRTRLQLFFVLIVVVPMIAVTLLVFRLIAESEDGQADARLAARQETAVTLYYDARAQADRLALGIGRDPELAAALTAGDRAAVGRAAQRLLLATSAQRIALYGSGAPLADVGDPRATFPASRTLTAQAAPVARLQVSVTTAPAYARLVRRVTNLETVVREGRHVLASTIAVPTEARAPPQVGRVTVDGRDYRSASFSVPGFRGARTSVSLLERQSLTSHEIRRGRLVASLILAGFFLLALVSAVVLARGLQRQIDSFLVAARRLAAGDFSAKIPTRGHDRFAQLGEEFNKMSRELERRLAELDQERLRLNLSLRRIGETFASSLDREGLLEIVVRTAVDALDARGGRVCIGYGPGETIECIALVGNPDGQAVAVDAAERRALATDAPAYADGDGVQALAHPLRAVAPSGDPRDMVNGIVTVWRDHPFSERERELFHYLAAQAAVSMENIALHETVERQALVDDLTGLSNRRRFQDSIAAEVERARRFGQKLGLVMLDLDDFKTINDTYGHQQGDHVLRQVAHVLRASAREIDECARYGGEELAVVLPGTDLVGAYNLAERVRAGVEALRVPILETPGAPPLRVTASLGAASLPESAEDVRDLIAAADRALYEAKRAGKNRTVRAA